MLDYLKLYLSFSIIAFFCVFSCNKDAPEKITGQPYLNLAPDVDYIGMQTCIQCHGNIHDDFKHTGMGQSFANAYLGNSHAVFEDIEPIYEENSNFYYLPFTKDSLIYIKEFRLNDNGDTIHQRTEKVSYIVGSGQHTNSHIIDINGYIYQAPITFYTQDKKWDMAPSYREQGNLRFDRLLNSECISCHNHFPTLAEGATNKFTQMPSGIACERCHGPGALHVAEKKAGKVVNILEKIDYTIVNPAKLPRDLQLDLCQRCHLQGTAVLEKGKTFYDFKPGMALSEVVNVFLPRFASSNKDFIMASQADRLRQSKCFQASDMTCLSCHNPHISVKKLDKDHFKNICLQCHKAEKSCLESQEKRNNVGDQCSQCHMPKSGSLDIAHVRITDHKIQVNPSKDNTIGDQQFYGLEMLTKNKPSHLDMARGYLALYDKYASLPYILDSVEVYLDKSDVKKPAFIDAKVHYLFNKKDYPTLASLFSNNAPDTIDDAWTAYRIGDSFYQVRDYEKALLFIQKAVHLQSLNLEFLEKEALVLMDLNQQQQAAQKFDFILSENPKRPIALCNRGFLFILQGNLKAGEALYDQAISLNPDYEQALLNKAAVRNILNDKTKALALINRCLKINPKNRQAQQALTMIK